MHTSIPPSLLDYSLSLTTIAPPTPSLVNSLSTLSPVLITLLFLSLKLLFVFFLLTTLYFQLLVSAKRIVFSVCIPIYPTIILSSAVNISPFPSISCSITWVPGSLLVPVWVSVVSSGVLVVDPLSPQKHHNHIGSLPYCIHSVC